MGLVQLHGLVPEGTPLQRDAPAHRLLPCDRMLALVSEFPDVGTFESLPPEDLADWALAHNAILSAYCGGSGVLPMRVGTVFSDDAAVRGEIAAGATTFATFLAAMQNLREYTVQLSMTQAGQPETVAEAARSGRAHLMARRQARDARVTWDRDRQALARDILAELDALATQVEPAGGPRPNRLLDCVALVACDRIDDLRRIARNHHDAAEALGLDLVIAGPWPPYSFDITAWPELELSHGV